MDEMISGSHSQSVLVLLGAYIPAYKSGGPIRSIENMVNALGHELDFKIVTPDRDLGDTEPFVGIVTGEWVKVGGAQVLYVPPGWEGLRRIVMLLSRVDGGTVLYLNSFFSLRFSVLAAWMRFFRVCRPRALVLAPRGEFSPGALELNPVRKKLFITMARMLRVYSGVVWHASTALEEADIARQFRVHARNGQHVSATILRALDIADACPSELGRHSKTPGTLSVVFIGRCSRKKNLAGALRLLSGIPGAISFDIYGPIEDAQYWKECQEIVASLPANVNVRYRGELEHALVSQVFAEYHLFLFPTLGENFGHVISESLQSGCPVLISDQTPWRDLEAAGVGWDIPLADGHRFRSALLQCIQGDDAWFAGFAARAKSYGISRASDPAIVEDNRMLFRSAFGASAALQKPWK